MKVPNSHHRVQFGTTVITFDLPYSQRKTLAIHVYPDCTVSVDAPKDTSMERIRELVLKSGAWILRHQRQFQDYAPRRGVTHGMVPTSAARVFRERWEEVAPCIAAISVSPPETFKLREMKSRWASCSSKGQISLNLKLIQVDKSLIDYVILHEVCHMRERNHSRAFYALLDRAVPDWKNFARS